LCAEWLKSSGKRTATGVDIHQPTLNWGKKHNLAPINEPGDRLELLCQDVRDKVSRKFDVINAMNFSYWIFKTRDGLREYFSCVRQGLAGDGIFVMDAYGGWESQEPMEETRSVRGKFTYIWDQDKFDPINNEILNHIHFEFKDGSRWDKAFTYSWRYWTLPELRELLSEAGFKEVHIYWDVAEDDNDENYQPRTRAANQPGWLAYLVALA
jgi:SAM-dependent methyltransferase